ncbi:conserved domain protein [Candidatus Moduliflexus flocculans]|uniref:Conserved domain protein n=1 Tax=Candidatus Moduliflexus flocculans TaxID=1499966 RepID=A0A0S6VS13_9BACT|nr:conserved domain protein [Candidatus Moduliflexus flocculans]
MNASQQGIMLGFTQESFPESGHICLIYENDEQRRKIVAQYLAAGVRQGELVRYFTDETTPETIRSWLLDMGVELPEVEEKGSFMIAQAENAYCPSGRFEPQAMIDGCVHRYDLAKQAGYHGVRSTGEMTWVLKGLPGSDRVLEYEALLNTVSSTFPHSGMCQYDARVFDGATLFKVIQIHPYMIAQGQVVRNPYYLPPQEFLAELTSKQS